MPSLISENLTLIVSPLISLMEDQVFSLKYALSCDYLFKNNLEIRVFWLNMSRELMEIKIILWNLHDAAISVFCI